MSIEKILRKDLAKLTDSQIKSQLIHNPDKPLKLQNWNRVTELTISLISGHDIIFKVLMWLQISAHNHNQHLKILKIIRLAENNSHGK